MLLDAPTFIFIFCIIIKVGVANIEALNQWFNLWWLSFRIVRIYVKDDGANCEDIDAIISVFNDL
jgi:hypothetical protein